MAPLRRSEPSDHALMLTVRILDDDLNRGDPLSRAKGRPAPPARKLGQLDTELVIYGFVEAHPDHAALALGEPEALVDADGHLHAPAHQPTGPIRASHSPTAGVQLRHRADVLAGIAPNRRAEWRRRTTTPIHRHAIIVVSSHVQKHRGAAAR